MEKQRVLDTTNLQSLRIFLEQSLPFRLTHRYQP